MLPAWTTARLGRRQERLRLDPRFHAGGRRHAGRVTPPTLSGGQQKMAALARALMAGRRLLILDEPFEGLAPRWCGVSAR